MKVLRKAEMNHGIRIDANHIQEIGICEFMRLGNALQPSQHMI
jgi:hypothetical protein